MQQQREFIGETNQWEKPFIWLKETLGLCEVVWWMEVTQKPQSESSLRSEARLWSESSWRAIECGDTLPKGHAQMNKMALALLKQKIIAKNLIQHWLIVTQHFAVFEEYQYLLGG